MNYREELLWILDPIGFHIRFATLVKKKHYLFFDAQNANAKWILAKAFPKNQPLLPYYIAENGGYLSEEYELLSHTEAVESTTEFYDYLKPEELLEHAPEGIVIAHCADGTPLHNLYLML